MQKTVWIDYDPKKVDIAYLIGRLESEGLRVIAEVVDFTDEDAIIRHALQADAVVAQGERWNEHTLDAVKGKVQIIVRFGVGMNGIDIGHATRLKIPVANIAGANAAAVAEVAFLHILNCGRRFAYCAENVRQGNWPATEATLGHELDQKTVGLFGLGNIARQLVRMLSGFHVEIVAYDPYVAPENIPENVRMLDSMEELFSVGDIISLHVPYTPETEKIIDARLLKLMKPTAYLVNTCRGGVINEEDLVAALRNGELGGAGLDVLADEPAGPGHPLLSMDNVTVTSHIGANAVESDLRGEKRIADTILEFFHGEIPASVLNKEVFAGRGNIK